MHLLITAVTASALSLLLVVLTIEAIRLRKTLGIPFGDGDHPRLRATIRAHANLVEYMPIGLTQLGILENNGAPQWALALIGIAFVMGRVIHAHGIRVEGARIGPRRGVGIMLTVGVLALLSLWLLAMAMAALSL